MFFVLLGKYLRGSSGARDDLEEVVGEVLEPMNSMVLASNLELNVFGL
jgi:hypothetical protein